VSIARPVLPVRVYMMAAAADWPGASSRRQNLPGTSIVARKPRHFFTSAELPDELELPLARPPGYEHLSQGDFAALLRERISDVERAAAAERAETGRSVLGRKTVLRQSFHDSPASFEPRRAMSPRIAGKNKWARIEALQRMKDWLAAYRDSWLRFASGVRDVLFPAGTYALRRHLGVCCAPAPDTG